MTTPLTERNYFRQAPAIVNGRYSLTKSESDLVYSLLSTIAKEDEDYQDYVFTKYDLEKKLGVKLDTAQLRATAKSLMSKVLEVIEDDEEWELLSWFSYFHYKKGVITCRFDKSMKPYLLELQQYVLADIRHIIQIQSEYSRRIYLLLKERLNFGTRTFNIEELQDILQVPQSYKRYDNFKRKVLETAERDINKYTDIRVSFTEKKVIRKVESITFSIKKNLVDFKKFVEYIRENHTNKALMYDDGKLVKCSLYGLLYYPQNPEVHLHQNHALDLWHYMHDNMSKLLIFQPTLLDE